MQGDELAARPGPSDSSSGSPDGPRRRTARRVWAVGLILTGLLGIGTYVVLTRSGRTQSAQTQSTNTNGGARPVPVATAAARKEDVSVYLTALGSVLPLNTVTVKSRIDGQLTAVHFREGDAVKPGDLLAEIDPRPFEVQLAQAEGQMTKDQALLDNARKDFERYRLLYTQDSIARQQVDTQESLVHQFEGTIKADQAQCDTAKLQLAYCRITAPLGGRVGLQLVDPGNMVHASDATGLVVITQLQPIAVVFAIPEDSLQPVLAQLHAGKHPAVEAYDREQTRRLATGSLLTADNQIDLTTGTVKLKAVFPNSDDGLFPNQFVNARLLLDVKRGATVVPVAAVQRGTQGSFVYVVQPDQTVAVRQIGLGVTQGDDVSITTGLSPGDVVVVDGADRLRDGSRVEVRRGGTPGRPASS
jgi:multidrug efflux system membrane fusion protein